MTHRALWYELVAILLACLVGWLLGLVDWRRAEQRPLVVWPERAVGVEWCVPWLYGGELSLSYHGSKAEASRLYAVLAGRMTHVGD